MFSSVFWAIVAAAIFIPLAALTIFLIAAAIFKFFDWLDEIGLAARGKIFTIVPLLLLPLAIMRAQSHGFDDLSILAFLGIGLSIICGVTALNNSKRK